MIVPVNYLAVVVAAIVAFVVGGLWYSVFFRDAWLRARGINPASISGGMKMPPQPMIIEFITTLVTAFVIAQFVTWVGASGILGGLVLGLWIWLGFYVTTMLGPVLWEKITVPHYVINVSLRLVNILLMAVIIASWQ